MSKLENNKAEGIVTLADQNYYLGLETLYISAQQSYPVPVTCFDIGLTEAQKRHAATHYPLLSIVPIPNTPDIRKIKEVFEDAKPLAKPGKRVWPLWICPFLIAASPYRRVFWLDADLVILRHLDQLFAMLDNGPVFTVENNAPECTANKPELYHYLPIEHSFDPQQPTANGGVSGWDIDRDREVLEAYMYPIRQACSLRGVRDSISWHDQGALIWAIQRHSLEKRVVQDTRWNLCVKHSPVSDKSYNWRPQVIAELKQDEPNACLLHWNGRRAPWFNEDAN